MRAPRFVSTWCLIVILSFLWFNVVSAEQQWFFRWSFNAPGLGSGSGTEGPYASKEACEADAQRARQNNGSAFSYSIYSEGSASPNTSNASVAPPFNPSQELTQGIFNVFLSSIANSQNNAQQQAEQEQRAREMRKLQEQQELKAALREEDKIMERQKQEAEEIEKNRFDREQKELVGQLKGWDKGGHVDPKQLKMGKNYPHLGAQVPPLGSIVYTLNDPGSTTPVIDTGAYLNNPLVQEGIRLTKYGLGYMKDNIVGDVADQLGVGPHYKIFEFGKAIADHTIKAIDEACDIMCRGGNEQEINAHIEHIQNEPINIFYRSFGPPLPLPQDVHGGE
jgi:hypothetical protein